MVSALFIMQHEYLTEVFNYILCCSLRNDNLVV